MTIYCLEIGKGAITNSFQLLQRRSNSNLNQEPARFEKTITTYRNILDYS